MEIEFCTTTVIGRYVINYADVDQADEDRILSGTNDGTREKEDGDVLSLLSLFPATVFNYRQRFCICLFALSWGATFVEN